MRDQDYYSLVREANRRIWEGVNTLKALQREWTALDYATTLAPGEGENAGLVPADLGAVVFDTTTALETVLAAGHATNMAKLL